MSVDVGQPWSLAPRKGKHYGTRILDRDGDEVMKVWGNGQSSGGVDGEPSDREKQYFGNWTQQRWDECCMDCHYESRRDLEIAQEIIRRINAEPPK